MKSIITVTRDAWNHMEKAESVICDIIDSGRAGYAMSDKELAYYIGIAVAHVRSARWCWFESIGVNVKWQTAGWVHGCKRALHNIDENVDRTTPKLFMIATGRCDPEDVEGSLEAIYETYRSAREMLGEAVTNAKKGVVS